MLGDEKSPSALVPLWAVPVPSELQLHHTVMESAGLDPS